MRKVLGTLASGTSKWVTNYVILNPVTWAIFINVAVTAAFAWVAVLQDRHKASEQAQTETAAEILTEASRTVVELFPPAQPASGAPSAAAMDAWKKFETDYWGKLALLTDSPGEDCLKQLHLALREAMEGRLDSLDRNVALANFQLRLSNSAKAFKEARGDEKLSSSLCSNHAHGG